MKPRTAFDPDGFAKPRSPRRFGKLASIACLLLVYVLLAGAGRGSWSARAPIPVLIPIPVPGASLVPPAGAGVPMAAPGLTRSVDPAMILVAPTGIDDRMTLAAPTGIDDAMVVDAQDGGR